MNNKETLQKHNIRLSENNIDINEILNTVNSLPTIDEVISLQDKTVDPSKETQTITADEEYNGLGTVTVNAIQSDSLEVSPSIEEQSFNGIYDNVKVNPVTSEIDSNIVAENIKEGVNILGVDGTLKGGSGKYAPRFISFYKYEGTDLDYEIRNLDVSNMSSVHGLFYSCAKLKSPPISDWDVSNISVFSQMCYQCRAVTRLDLSKWKPNKIMQIYGMCYQCSELIEIDLRNFETPEVTDMKQLFCFCNKLQKIDIRNFTFDKVTNTSSMFNQVPENCLIIVKGETEKAFVLNVRSDLTNVKTVAEYEAS